MASSVAWTSLPKEMWIEIWSNLDFDTQKICTRVSKEWKKNIRGSTRLSSEIFLNLDFGLSGGLSVEDINTVLSSWPQLKTLHVKKLDFWAVVEEPRPAHRQVALEGRYGLSVEDINDVLSSWPKLKTLHVANLDSISRPGINLKNLGELQIFGTTKFVENFASLIENDDSHNLAFRYNDAAFVADGNSSGIKFFRTCNILLFSCTHLALWRRQGERFKNFFILRGVGKYWCRN